MLDSKNLKMYIAVLDEVPDFITPTLVAHAVLGAHLIFQERLFYSLWLNNSFKKVVVKVNSREFQKISSLENVYLAHENKTLEGKDSCIVICPRIDIPNVLKFSKLWKPSYEYTNHPSSSNYTQDLLKALK